MSRWDSDFKIEKFGAFTIYFYDGIEIMAEARFQDARAAIAYGRNKAIAFERLKERLRKQYPLQTRKKLYIHD